MRAVGPLRASLASRERNALCDLLLELGPDAPTLCAGWRSVDLAAHLYVRDHRPDTMPGMNLKVAPLAHWTERVQQGARDRLAWDELVSHVRSGPPKLLRRVDASINTLEFFVHHEDLRRAQPGWEPRPLSPADEAELWRYMGWLKRRASEKKTVPGAVATDWLQPDRLAPAQAKAHIGVNLKGPVGEVALWVMGRRSVARAAVVDPEAA